MGLFYFKEEKMSLVEERYSKWLNHKNLDPQYKPVLENMSAEEKMMHFIQQLNLVLLE